MSSTWVRRAGAAGLLCGSLMLTLACATQLPGGGPVPGGVRPLPLPSADISMPASTTPPPTDVRAPSGPGPTPVLTADPGTSGPSAPATLLTTVASPPPVATSAVPPPMPTAGGDPFAGRRIVAYYGEPDSAGLGILGRGTPAAAWAALDRQAAPYGTAQRPALRCFELIATVASDSPGAGGLYRNRISSAAIAPYLQEVRAHGGTLLLDIQPGRANFLAEAQALQPWLEQPDVGLALDPEWRMGPDEIPGRVIGSVSAAEVNSVSAWLSRLTVAGHLPDKLFVVHQFTGGEIGDEDDLASAPHLHEILNVDGFGGAAAKIAIYTELAARSPFPTGLKLFYRQDIGLLPPARVLAIRPAPSLIDYE